MDSEAQRVAVCCDLVSDVVRISGEVTLKLMGTSMLPVIWPGDLVTVRPCDVSELAVGQIILYRREGILTAHRIVRVRREHLILRGDSLDRCDPPVEMDQVVGCVCSVRRNGVAVSLGQGLHRRIASFAISRSELCRRLVFRFGNS